MTVIVVARLMRWVTCVAACLSTRSPVSMGRKQLHCVLEPRITKHPSPGKKRRSLQGNWKQRHKHPLLCFPPPRFHYNFLTLPRNSILPVRSGRNMAYPEQDNKNPSPDLGMNVEAHASPQLHFIPNSGIHLPLSIRPEPIQNVRQGILWMGMRSS